MKNHIMRNLLIIAVVLIASMGLMAFRPFQGETPPAAVGEPLTVPVEVQVFLTGAVIFLLTAGIKALTQAFPKIPNLEGPATVFAGAVVTFVVVLANALLALVPPEFKVYAVLIFTGIASWLGANGYALLVKSFQKKAVAFPSTDAGTV